MSADAETAALAATYLLWFVPAMALQFLMVAMGSALRAVGNFKTGTVVGTVTVILNMLLAPILIFGWGTGRPLGVAGAAISSLVAIVVGNVWLAAYFLPRSAYLRFETADWRPRFDLWKRMLAIGLPTGFEFAITAAYLAIVYAVDAPVRRGGAGRIRDRDADLSGGLHAGRRARLFRCAGGRSELRCADRPHRVKHTFRDAAWMAGGLHGRLHRSPARSRRRRW